MDTIVALSSGRPPAAIGIVRVSGPAALEAVARMAGPLPEPRRAVLRALRDASGALLDRALVLVFPGPASATGEDLVELHCHGGRAVVTAVEAALKAVAGVRAAEPGEFTRRALLNGRIDLAEAEGLADLLEAETEGQRRAALAASEGRLSRAIRGWMERLSDLSARVEVLIDYADDDDADDSAEARAQAAVVIDADQLRSEILTAVSAPPVERVRDGIRVVIGGPPNTGKSTLLNVLTERDAAIVSPYAGTTRDRIEAGVQRDGVAYLMTDTAGLNDAADPVERIGVTRAEEAITAADLLIWLADTPPPREDALWLQARADLPGRGTLPPGKLLAVSQDQPESIERLWSQIGRRAAELLPSADDLPFKERQRQTCVRVAEQLGVQSLDLLILAEHLRTARHELGVLLGLDATEAMLDALFTRFCLGK